MQPSRLIHNPKSITLRSESCDGLPGASESAGVISLLLHRAPEGPRGLYSLRGSSHSEAPHLDRGTGGEAGHPRHQALCSFEGAEIPRARFSYGRRPDSISPAALLARGGGWQVLSLQVKSRSFTIPLYRSCLMRWGSASLMPLTRASGIT
jgi:hypothetical protein